MNKPLHSLIVPITTLLALLSPNAFARSDYYFGRLDKYPIVVELQRDGDSLSGWYFYRAQAKEIQLDGSVNRDGTFRLLEMVGGKKTAIFEGTVKDDAWAGNWHKLTDNTPSLRFAFKPAGKLPAALDGSYYCSGKRHDFTANGQYQSDLRWNLKLAIAAGRVRTFVANQTTRMDDHSEQACSIDLRDLRQQPAPVGALLKATDDAQEGEIRTCTVQVVGDADTAVVKFGASGKDGDDCHGAGTTLFCSARGGWADVVLDRKANTCKALQ